MIQQLSQNDIRWKNIKLGTSSVTIGGYGCAITSIAMIIGTTPDIVNTKLITVGGYLDGNLVIWDKIKTAFPETVESIKRVWNYDNTDVKANLPCIVQVDGTPLGYPTHFVIYIGNRKLIDPWDGKIKSTSTYVPHGYCVIKTKQIIPQPSEEEVLNKRIIDLEATEQRLRGDITQKDQLISHLNQQINDRNNDITRLNAEISTARQELLETMTQRDLAQGQAKQIISLREQIDELERQKKLWSEKEEKYLKTIEQFKSTSYVSASKGTLFVELLKRFLP